MLVVTPRSTYHVHHRRGGKGGGWWKVLDEVRRLLQLNLRGVREGGCSTS